MISPDSAAPPSPASRQLSLEELSDTAGIDGADIRHYIDQELLPPPAKISGDTIYYDVNCVELLKLIQTFHRKHALPLSLIRQVIREVGYEKAHRLTEELEEKLHRARQLSWLDPSGDTADGETMLTRQELLAATELSPESLESAIRQNLLAPDETGRFTRKDLEVALILSEIRNNQEETADILADLLNMRLKMAETLVEEEFNVFLKNIVNNNISVEDANELANKSFDLLVDLFPKCYWQLLNRKMKQLLANDGQTGGQTGK